MDARIFNILARVQGEQDEGRREELMAQTNEELAQHFMRHAGDMEELAFDLFNQAFADVMKGDLVSSLVDVKTVGIGDTDWIEEDLRGMRAYFQGKGGQIRSDVLTYERAAMPREELVSAIDLHQDEVTTNFWGVLGTLQEQCREKMRMAPAQRLLALVQAAVTGGSNYGEFAAASLADTQVDPILNYVSQRSGGRATIFGTLQGIRQFSNIGLEFGDAVKQDIFRTGIIGTYKGYPVLQLENWEDFNGQYALPDDELFVVGRNAGRVTYYGAQAKVQQLRLPSFWMRWETARDIGISVYGAGKGRIGRIVLT